MANPVDIVDALYGEELDKRDAMIDAMFSPDVTLEHFSFNIQGRPSIKNIFNLYRVLNKGKSMVQSVHFNPENNTILVNFDQEYEPRFLGSHKFNYPALTVLHLREVEEDRWMISQVKEVIDPKHFISAMPLIGSFYTSFARPLAGFSLVTLAGFFDTQTVQKAYTINQSIATIAGAIQEKADEIPVHTQNQLSSVEKVSRQESVANSNSSSNKRSLAQASEKSGSSVL